MNGLSDVFFQDIIVAMLAVNSYPLEKAEALRGKLAKEITVGKAAHCSHEEAIGMLISAGYDRGPVLTSLIASRIQELGFFAEKNGFGDLERYVADRDEKAVERYLLGLYGVGPKVAGNFLTLRGLA